MSKWPATARFFAIDWISLLIYFSINEGWPCCVSGVIVLRKVQVSVGVRSRQAGSRHAGDDHPPVGARDSGDDVSAATSRRIGCDSSIVNIVEDEKGEPLSIGRCSRTIPPPMRRALRIRDGGCRFPGCTNTKFVDGHHIKHWADGGETSLDNLVSLCRRHHHLVHEGGFACEKSADGEVYFSDRGRKPLPNWSNLPKVASDHDVQQWLDREFFAATENGEGCHAKWYAGDRMDWSMAVSALFPMRS